MKFVKIKVIVVVGLVENEKWLKNGIGLARKKEDRLRSTCDSKLKIYHEMQILSVKEFCFSQIWRKTNLLFKLIINFIFHRASCGYSRWL